MSSSLAPPYFRKATVLFLIVFSAFIPVHTFLKLSPQCRSCQHEAVVWLDTFFFQRHDVSQSRHNESNIRHRKSHHTEWQKIPNPPDEDMIGDELWEHVVTCLTRSKHAPTHNRAGQADVYLVKSVSKLNRCSSAPSAISEATSEQIGMALRVL